MTQFERVSGLPGDMPWDTPTLDDAGLQEAHEGCLLTWSQVAHFVDDLYFACCTQLRVADVYGHVVSFSASRS